VGHIARKSPDRHPRITCRKALARHSLAGARRNVSPRSTRRAESLALIALDLQEQTAKDAMDAKGAKDSLGQHLLPSGSVVVNCPGTRRGTKHPEGVLKFLQGSLWFRLSAWEQSLASLASFAV